jgi:hypothetical protein
MIIRHAIAPHSPPALDGLAFFLLSKAEPVSKSRQSVANPCEGSGCRVVQVIQAEYVCHRRPFTGRAKAVIA